GPYKGGIRFHQDVTRAEAVLLSKLMTFKNSLAGIPYGGGKGGVRFNPKGYSKAELERVCRAYVRGIVRDIGPDKDIPAPDVNTTAEMMAWMVDEYNKLTGTLSYAAFTGKPVEFNGLRGRDEATGRGAYFIMVRAFKEHDVPKSAAIAVQGFGNVGMNIARILHENGYKVVAVSDSKGGIYCKGGLDIPAVIKIKSSGGSVQDYSCPGLVKITNEQLIECDCDVLVPAALDNQIHKGNAGKVKAKYVFEAANNPTTDEADEMLARRGVLVFPDILVNCGGVSASYIEWVQNREGRVYAYEQVLNELEQVMGRAFSLVAEQRRKDPKITYREAAYRASIIRLTAAMKYQF
ncbi:MAG: Glu/Leu/Phe/Val dehydrogenase, partial [Candidatus Micrarchaeota archaeon]|nr:Glu/Leu/Phe/Val dehydrogenase [Candidatus Micrarchaeota archaeon]